MKYRARKKTDDWAADFGCDDIQELMKSCTPPWAAPATSQDNLVREAFEGAGFRILWFLWEERPKGTVCEVGLERITAPQFEDDPHLIEHFREILHRTQTDVSPDHIVVSRHSEHPNHIDVGFAILIG
jgi:hypothetical protein